MSITRKSGLGSDALNSSTLFGRRPGDGIIVVDSKHSIQSLSKSAERVCGLQSSEVIKRDAKVLPAALRRVLDRVFATGKPVENRPIILPSRSGTVIACVTALPLQAGKARSGVAVAIIPVDPVRQFEQNVRRLDRLANIGMLSAGMAHEIKNALVAVKTFIDLLLDKNQDAELADVVRREMRRINSLVSQTLKFAGPSRPAFSAVRLHDILDVSLRMVQPQIKSRLVAVRRSFQATPDVVRGDDYQLEQVFVNLFLNAVESMGMSGSLVVATEMASSSATRSTAVPHVRTTISDTGSGISPENMKRLFEPFYTTKENGTGLGLAIARRIVEEHAGFIEARSEINKGTSISVLIPAHSAAD